jgi:hypothetical protein
MVKRAFVLAMALLALGSTAAFAASGHAHFIKNATGGTLNGSALTCTFKEAGLAAGSVETVTCGATEVVTYECVNGGGKNPSASNKTSITRNVSQSGQFTADRNGNLVGSLTLTPLTAEEVGFACPPGQTTTFVGVTYSNVSITDSTSGATTNVPGTFSYTNPAAP